VQEEPPELGVGHSVGVENEHRQELERERRLAARQPLRHELLEALRLGTGVEEAVSDEGDEVIDRNAGAGEASEARRPLDPPVDSGP